jgi:hypothetical protein
MAEFCAKCGKEFQDLPGEGGCAGCFPGVWKAYHDQREYLLKEAGPVFAKTLKRFVRLIGDSVANGNVPMSVLPLVHLISREAKEVLEAAGVPRDQIGEG